MGSYKIPGWLYLIFGGLVAGYSQFVINAKGVDNTVVFNFFFYVGLLLLVIGIFKIVLKFILHKKDEEVETQTFNKPLNNNLVRCSKCNSNNYRTYNFCYKCGNKLK